MNSESPVQARVTQQFNVAAERVFDAWMDPDLIGQWMFGPALREEEVVRLTVDARVGGAFSFVVRRQGQEIDHIGEYLEIDRPHRLVFTWGARGHSDDESRVIVTITPLTEGCELTLVHEMSPQWADFVDRSRAGWAKMVGVLADQLTATAQNVVELSVWVAASPEHTWQAITEPQQLEQWFAPGCAWEIDTLVVGGTVKFYNTPDDVALHTIEILDPPREFALRWYEQDNPMLTTFRLTAENGGVRVTVIESGFAALPTEVRAKRLAQTVMGYTGSLENLQALVEGRSVSA
jgi:uncharacterized protein YndB with AHSA1/START domain